MIYFKEITKIFNNKIILNNFNLIIDKGEHAVVTGRSGKGKSTLFSLLMGFVFPDQGQIFVNDILMQQNNIIELRKLITWLPQNLDILGRNSIKKRIYQIANYSDNKNIEITNHILKDELEKLNLDSSILDQNFSDISGGEKQRIGILICKLLNRPILILDEPTSALDKENIKTITQYICPSNQTIISASHDEDWINQCNKIVEI